MDDLASAQLPHDIISLDELTFLDGLMLGQVASFDLYIFMSLSLI